jgi:hypothetical protein
MHGETRSLVVRSPRVRSRVSNGKSLFVEADGRSVWARRYRDLCESFVRDAGGFEALSQLKLSLIRRAAAIAVQCELLEGRLADGDPEVDIDLLARMSSHLRRIAETIGLDRAKRDVTPKLGDILKANASKGSPR